MRPMARSNLAFTKGEILAKKKILRPVSRRSYKEDSGTEYERGSEYIMSDSDYSSSDSE